MNFIRIPIFLALFIIACLTNAQASKTFELNEIADLSKKILQERLDTFDPLKEKSVVELNKDLGHQKVVFDVQNGQFVTTVLDTEDGISQQVVSFDLPKDKPLRFSRHYTQMGKLVGYLDLEIDPPSKSLKFFGLKSPNCFIFEFGTYNLCFGETEKWFTTLLGKNFEFSCTSCSTPYCGIDISGYCEILSRQAFTFGSAYTTKQTVTIDIYGKPYSALYTYQVNTGSYIKAEGLKIFSPTINLSCGDISVTNLWTLPSSVNAMIADSHYPEESDYVPVNTIRIYSAQLYVDDTWFLVARDIPIKVDYELVRFLAIDHPNHRQMGVNILTPSARQPKVVVKGKTLMAFKSMTITDDNESGCYTSFVPHNYLSVRDPYLEKFYGKNSFLESFETPEAWEKCDKHQCGHGTKETKWQCLRGKLSIEEFRKHLVESKEKPYYTREDLLEASESSSFNDSGWGFGRDSFSSFNRGSNLQAPLPTFYPSNLNLTFQALLSPETPNHIKGIVLGLSLLDHTIKTFNCMKDMQFRLKLNEERSKQTQSGTLPIIGSNSNLNTNLHILTPEEKKEGKKPEKKESVFEPFEKKDLSGKGLFTDLMDKDLPKQNPLIPNVIQNQKSTTSNPILVQEEKKDLSGKGLFKSLMEEDLGNKGNIKLPPLNTNLKILKSEENPVFQKKDLSAQGQFNTLIEELPKTKLSPRKLKDTPVQELSSGIEKKIQKSLEETNLFDQGKPLEWDTIGYVAGGHLLYGVGHTYDFLDLATGGGLSWVGEKVDDLSKSIETGVRRGTRDITGDQRFAQNVSEGFSVGLNLVGGKYVFNSLKTASTWVKASKKLQALDLAVSQVWKEGSVTRGIMIEKTLGQNLHQNFPVIDRFLNGVVTSIKSIDLNAMTYQNPTRLNSILKKYVDKVAEFEKGGVKKQIIESKEITGRTLDLAIPHAGNTIQQKVIQEVVEYAKTKNVGVNVIKI